jgi:hypothetical protein
MTDTELSKPLGISRQAVAKLRKKGMPTGSLEEVHAWRGQRAKMNGKPYRSFGVTRTILASSDNPEDTLKQLRDSLAKVDEEIELARMEGDRRNLAALWRELRGLSQARIDYERLLLSWRVEKGELIRVDDAIAKYAGGLAEIRSRLANTPDRLCGLLNPESPDAARKILWAELELIGAAVGEKLRAL